MFRKRIQLGLIHVAAAMTLVPINSTLNRVMIKELALPATLVAVLASLPYLFSPIQVAIGTFTDQHPLWGWRRTPYIVLGLALCIIGVMIAPQAAFVMAENFWAGLVLGVLSFGAWGMGFNFATVAYLSLAAEISGQKGRSRTVSLMWFMMIAGIIVTAIALSRMLDPYTEARLTEAFRTVALLAAGLAGLGLWGLEPRQGKPIIIGQERVSWVAAARTMLGNPQARSFFGYLILLLAAILGQDILLEPFAAEAFHMPVTATTRITSIWGGCVLVALLVAGLLEERTSKRHVAIGGAVGAMLAFGLIALSGLAGSQGLFYSAVVLLGLSTGLSTVSNLSLMMDMTIPGSVGLFMGAWGMADALARGLGAILSGVVRDITTQLAHNALIGYALVFTLEAVMLAASLWLLRRVDVASFHQAAQGTTQPMSVAERAAMLGDR